MPPLIVCVILDALLFRYKPRRYRLLRPRQSPSPNQEHERLPVAVPPNAPGDARTWTRSGCAMTPAYDRVCARHHLNLSCPSARQFDPFRIMRRVACPARHARTPSGCRRRDRGTVGASIVRRRIGPPAATCRWTQSKNSFEPAPSTFIPANALWLRRASARAVHHAERRRTYPLKRELDNLPSAV